MSDQHLALWDRVWQTDPSYTKAVQEGKRTYTSINATYMVRQATAQWGPLGIGWGYEIVEERFDEGGPIVSDKGDVLGTMVMHTLLLKLWYEQDGKRGEVTHFGNTPYVQRTKWGASTDMDAPKKSLTDALKKCLSMLGFSADIFLGLYDLPEYVEERRVEEGIRRADDADEAMVEQRSEFNEWIAQQMRGYAMVPSKGALKVMHQATVNKARRRAATLKINPDQVEERLEERHRERLAELSPDTALVCHDCGSEQQGKEGQQCKDCGSKKTAPAGTGANDQQGNGENQ